MTEENKSKPVSIEEYRRQLTQIKEITLPESKLMFKIKRLTALDYLQEGLDDIPNEFIRFIAEVQAGEMTTTDPEKEKKNTELFERFLSLTLELGVVEPKVIFKYDKEKIETHLLFYELSANDQVTLIQAIMGKQ